MGEGIPEKLLIVLIFSFIPITLNDQYLFILYRDYSLEKLYELFLRRDKLKV
jgi:hypothetical protein